MYRIKTLKILIVIETLLIILITLFFIKFNSDLNNYIETMDENIKILEENNNLQNEYIENLKIYIQKLENEQKTAETGNSDIQKFTNEELKSVCQVVSAEARGESYEGQCLVAQVIKNRSELWNKDIDEVINAPNQFAKGIDYVTDSVYLAVEDVFLNGKQITDEPITHFHSTLVSPYWADEKELVIKEGDHLFYK